MEDVPAAEATGRSSDNAASRLRVAGRPLPAAPSLPSLFSDLVVIAIRGRSTWPAGHRSGACGVVGRCSVARPARPTASNRHARVADELLAVAESRREPADVRPLLGQHERDAVAAAARAAGAADAVHVVVVALRRVEVDHVRDVVDVEAAGGDVRCDERRDAPDSNCASARSRWFCERLPCIATRRDLVLALELARRACRRRASSGRRRARGRGRPRRCSTSRSSLSSAVTETKVWSISPRSRLGRQHAADVRRRCTV